MGLRKIFPMDMASKLSLAMQERVFEKKKESKEQHVHGHGSKRKHGLSEEQREFRMARNGACVVGRRAGRREAEEDSGDWLSILEFRFYPKSIL